MSARPGSAGALLAIVPLVLTGCGGGEGEPVQLTAGEYADAMESARIALADRYAALNEDMAEYRVVAVVAAQALITSRSFKEWRQNAESSKKFLVEVAEANLDPMEGYHDDLRRVLPPAQLTDGHQGLVTTINAFLEEGEALIDDMGEVGIGDAETEEEVQYLFNSVLRRITRSLTRSHEEFIQTFSASCTEWQAELERELGTVRDICPAAGEWHEF